MTNPVSTPVEAETGFAKLDITAQKFGWLMMVAANTHNLPRPDKSHTDEQAGVVWTAGATDADLRLALNDNSSAAVPLHINSIIKIV